jgi:hypothetical protein
MALIEAFRGQQWWPQGQQTLRLCAYACPISLCVAPAADPNGIIDCCRIYFIICQYYSSLPQSLVNYSFSGSRKSETTKEASADKRCLPVALWAALGVTWSSSLNGSVSTRASEHDPQ